MATYSKAHFADWKVPGPSASLEPNPGIPEEMGHLVGLQEYTAPGTSVLPPSGNTNIYKRYLTMVEDYNGIGTGRISSVFDRENSTIDKTIRWLGDAGVDLPDFVVADDAVLMLDGQGRYGAGTAPFSHVFLDDGGVFTDYSTAAQNPTAGDVGLLPNANAAVGDAFYFGAASTTFSGVAFYISQAHGFTGSLTIVAEYWDSSAWSTLTIATASPNNAVATDEFGRTGWQILTWTPPADWATTSVNSQTNYWVRFRVSVSAHTLVTQPLATCVFAIENSAATKGRLPAALDFTSDPETNGISDKGWGLHRLETGNTAQVSVVLASSGSIPSGVVNVYYSWWDSTREIGTDPVSLGSVSPTGGQKAIVTVGAHPDFNVSHVRIFFEGVSGNIAVEPRELGDTSRIGTGTLVLVAQFAVVAGASDIADITGSTLDNSRWEFIDTTRYGDGPYVISSDAIEDGKPATTHGTYFSCDMHLGRAFVGGSYVAGFERRLAWSQPANPWCFPTSRHVGENWRDVPAANGDRIVAVRSLGSTIVVLMRRSIWMGVGDPGQGSFALREVAKIGAVAKKACVVAGQRCFFLGADGVYAVDAGGSVQEVGGDIVDLIRGATTAALPNAVGAYDPSREVLAFGLSGLQAQTEGGASPGQTLNDGLLVVGLRTGRWSLWGGTGCFAASLASVTVNDAAFGLASGSYWGRVHLFDYSTTQDTGSSAIANGTVGSGSGASTLVAGTPANGTVQDSSTKRTQVGEFLVKYNSTNGFEARLISKADGTDFTEVLPNWTNAPVSGDSWWIGAYPVVVAFGDWSFAGRRKLVRTVQPHLEDALASGNTLDLAVDPTDVADTDSGYTYSSGTYTAASSAHEKLINAASGGYSQRIRLASWLNAARWVMRSLTVELDDYGDPHGG